MQSQTTVTCILLLSVPHLVLGGVVHKMALIVNNAEVVSDQRYLNASVKLSRFAGEPHVFIEMTFVVLQKLNDLTLQVRYLVPIAGIENPFYDATVDLCSFMRRPTDRIINLVFQEIAEHGPMPTTCPVYPKRIVFSNISLTHVKLPLYMPEARFTLLVKCWTKQKTVNVYDGRWFGQLKKVVVGNA